MQNSAIFVWLLVSISVYMNINATHFEGGTITYKVVNTSGSTVSILLTQTYIYDYTKIGCNNSMIANQWPKLAFSGIFLENNASVSCIQYCNQSSGFTPVPVVSYCTDYSVGLGITVGQRSDKIDLVNGSNFLVAFQSRSWRQLSRPPNSSSLTTYWSILCAINLQMRPDGTYNHPPAAAIISPIYIPVGIQETILIPTIDADNDVVRCRFANGTNECASACPPATLPTGTVLFENCTLLITGMNINDWYAIAIQIEDFINSTSTTRISTVPLQFLINVQNVSSCSQRPRLTGPTAQTGQCVGIQVGQTYVIQLVAENFCPSTTTIKDIATLSFPIVVKPPIVQNTTTLWSVTLTWVPTASEVGSQVLCAVAVDSNNVQSNQYCMTFIVSEDSVPPCPGETTTTQMTTVTTTGTTSTTTTVGSTTTSTTTQSTTTTTTATASTTSTTITTESTTTTETTSTTTTTSTQSTIQTISTTTSNQLTTTTTTSIQTISTLTTTVQTMSTITTTQSTTTVTVTPATSMVTATFPVSTTATLEYTTTTTTTQITLTVTTTQLTSLSTTTTVHPSSATDQTILASSSLQTSKDLSSWLIITDTTGLSQSNSNLITIKSTLVSGLSSDSTASETFTGQSKSTTYTSLDSNMLSVTSVTSASLPTINTASSQHLTTETSSHITLKNNKPSLTSTVSSTTFSGQSTDSKLNSQTTESSSPSSGVTSWPWFPLLLGIAALILIALSICCCCLCCCPRLCLCCPLKRRQKSTSALREPCQENGLLYPPIYCYLVDTNSEQHHHLDDDIFDAERSSSVTSNRTTDDVQLSVLSSARQEKKIPHYATALKRSPRVAPTPSLSISISSVPSTSRTEYLSSSQRSAT